MGRRSGQLLLDFYLAVLESNVERGMLIDSYLSRNCSVLLALESFRPLSRYFAMKCIRIHKACNWYVGGTITSILP